MVLPLDSVGGLVDRVVGLSAEHKLCGRWRRRIVDVRRRAEVGWIGLAEGELLQVQGERGRREEVGESKGVQVLREGGYSIWCHDGTTRKLSVVCYVFCV